MRFLSSLLAAFLLRTGAGAQDCGGSIGWPHHGGSQFAWRYSALDQVNTANVKTLGVAWAFQTGDYGDSLQSTPLVIDGVMYVSTSYAQVFALDASSGGMIWRYKYPLSASAGRSGRRGVSYQSGPGGKRWQGFSRTPDSKSGGDRSEDRPRIGCEVDDSNQCGCSITSAPLVVKDKVVVGGSGGDNAHRGYLTAFYFKTGGSRGVGM